MMENKTQRLAHVEKVLSLIKKEQKLLEQKRINYSILRAKLLTE